MDQLDSNNRWLMAAIAVVALLGAFTIGESANPGGGGSGEPVTVIERTVVEKEDNRDEDDRGAGQRTGQGAAQGDDQDGDLGDDRGEYRDDVRDDGRDDDGGQGDAWDDDDLDDAEDDLDD